MKNSILAGTILLLFLMPKISEGATNHSLIFKETSKKVQLFDGGRRNKNGQYRKKKGFLWGLFKGKNACDCPKH